MVAVIVSVRGGEVGGTTAKKLSKIRKKIKLIRTDRTVTERVMMRLRVHSDMVVNKM